MSSLGWSRQNRQPRSGLAHQEGNRQKKNCHVEQGVLRPDKTERRQQDRNGDQDQERTQHTANSPVTA